MNFVDFKITPINRTDLQREYRIYFYSENDCDLYWIPRVNTVDGLTKEHIAKWGWNVNDEGWVNFPDYQARLYKNVDYINWIRPVHEIVDGSKTHTYLPKEELFSIRHHKNIETNIE